MRSPVSVRAAPASLRPIAEILAPDCETPQAGTNSLFIAHIRRLCAVYRCVRTSRGLAEPQRYRRLFSLSLLQLAVRAPEQAAGLRNRQRKISLDLSPNPPSRPVPDVAN